MRRRVSSLGKVGEQDAVVCVRRSRWERVTLSEELVGRLRVGLRLPQYLGKESASVAGIHDRGIKEDEDGACVYLITAILTGAVVLARKIWDCCS